MNVLYIKFPSNRSYGVELETDYSASKSILAEAIKRIDTKNPIYSSNWSSSNNNKYWHVKPDSSCGYEVASYKSTGHKDLQNIAKVTDSIKEIGAQVNKKCGFHIHVEIIDFKVEDVAILVSNWMKLELTISQLLPSNRINNKYCKLLNDRYNWLSHIDLKNFTPKTFWQEIKPKVFLNANVYRRTSLNFLNYYMGVKKTIELRMPEGTLDSEDVKNWTRLFLNFVDFSKKNRNSLPKNTNYSDLEESLKILGLASDDETKLILSKSMFEAKTWFLKRILKYSNNEDFCESAINNLNKMWNPVRRYELSKNSGYFWEFQYEKRN